jgi:hypothetical protein
MKHFPRKKLNVQKYNCPHDTCPSWKKKVRSLAIWLKALYGRQLGNIYFFHFCFCCSWKRVILFVSYFCCSKKFCFSVWYVANIFIIFDAPCLFYTNCFMFCLHFVAFLCIF